MKENERPRSIPTRGMVSAEFALSTNSLVRQLSGSTSPLDVFLRSADSRFMRLLAFFPSWFFTSFIAVMITLSPLRWGKPYESLDFTDVVHFDTGEPIARVGNVGGGIVGRDMRKAHKAREALLQFSTDDLVERCKQAAVLFEICRLERSEIH